jgi:chromosome segregation ATPase
MFIINRFPLSILGLTILSACGGSKADLERQQSTIDSLQAQLSTTLITMETLQQVGAWMDSIDTGRERLELSLESGIKSDDFVARMESINKYVKDSERKIAELESALGKSSSQAQSYAGTISRLRKQLQEKNDEVAELQSMVTRYRSENQDLISAVTMREEELKQKDTEIEIKRQELRLLENRITSLLEAAQVNQADALFARAEAIEEAARRTRLAPNKKRETFLEALDLYRQANNLGHPEAQAKIDELQKLVNNR